MAKPCSVSVLVPVCNVEQYLRQCLESLTAQTLDDMQFICIDDGSTDSSLHILREFEAIDPRIEVITKPNSGYGNSMNIGLTQARGEYVGIVESDDFAEPDMFESLLSFAKQHDADIVKSNFYAHARGSDPKNDPVIENLEGCTYDTAFLPQERQEVFLGRPAIWSALYRTAYLKENDIRFLETPGASFQDTSFNFKALAAAGRAALTKHAYLHYRIDNSNSSVKSQKKVFCVCDEYAEIWRWANERDEVRKALSKRIPQLQFGGYAWNLDRLTPSLQPEFYQRFVEEFSALDEKGLLDAGCFDPVAWSRLREMLDNPEDHFSNRYGPSRITATRIVIVEDCPPETHGQIVDLALKAAGSEDEITFLSSDDPTSLAAAVLRAREKDKRVFPCDEFFSCLEIQELAVERVRGERLSLTRISSKEGIAHFKGLSEDSTQNDHIEYRTEDLATCKAPLLLPLMATGFYAKAEPSRTASRPEGEAAVTPTRPYRIPEGTWYEEAAYERMLFTMREVATHCNLLAKNASYEERKKMLAALKGPWLALRSCRRMLSDDAKVRQCKRPSPLMFDAAVFRQQPQSKKGPLVSVVIPVFNAERYLEECLSSVLSQEIESMEVVCVDDGSDDSSLALLEKAAHGDERIIVAAQLNGGAGAARNRGVSLARGRYIAFVDPDDYYPSSTTLSSLVQAAESNDALMCGGSFSTVNPDGEVTDRFVGRDSFYTFKSAGFRSLADDCTDYGWIRFIYRKSLLDELGTPFPETSWYEDPVFFLRAAGAAQRYFAITDVVYRYRVDYKKVVWDAQKTCDLLDGIATNLAYARENDLDRLYSLLIRRLDWDYCKPIVQNASDNGVFSRLLSIQQSLDFQRIDFVRENGLHYHLLQPLKDIRSQMFEETAVVRLARKIERSKFYKALQSVREKIPEE